ncbi:hypothetical protein BKA14_003718 [Actinoplanes abujensis]|uniref:Uncharacterized protein n=1 Tax=Paractinoplanes abujensis TaxID=882441 RepID=A0A7W7CRU7_9ACTN|nr:hypothetical protein [Actinoplanes abujensis]
MGQASGFNGMPGSIRRSNCQSGDPAMPRSVQFQSSKARPRRLLSYPLMCALTKDSHLALRASADSTAYFSACLSFHSAIMHR